MNEWRDDWRTKKTTLKVSSTACIKQDGKRTYLGIKQYHPIPLSEIIQLSMSEKKLEGCLDKTGSSINSLNRDVKDVQKVIIEKEYGV